MNGLLTEFEKASPEAEPNARILAELTMMLDVKSSSLTMKDAKDQGKEAVEILREHHLGESKPRIVSLYGELASLKMEATENTLR